MDPETLEEALVRIQELEYEVADLSREELELWLIPMGPGGWDIRQGGRILATFPTWQEAERCKDLLEDSR